MPNWQKIADAIGQGLYGDEIQQFKAKKQAMQDASARLLLAQNEDTRAGSREGRAAEQDTYDRSRRGVREQADAQSLERGGLEIGKSKRDNEVFDASGGVAGAANRVIEDDARKGREEKRADRRLGLSGQEVALRLALVAQENKDKKVREDRAKQDQNFQRAGVQGAFDAASDPLGDDLYEVKRIQKLMEAGGSSSTGVSLDDQLAAAVADVNRKRAVRQVKRSTVVGPTQ